MNDCRLVLVLCTTVW